jgi:hypothetical protein
LIRIVIKLIAFSLNHVSMDVDGSFDGGFYGWFNGGFYGRFNSGFDGQFNLPVLGYQPQQIVRQLRQEAKLTHHFTDLFYRLC